MRQIEIAYWIKILATLAVFAGLIVLFLRSGGKEESGGRGASLDSVLESLGEEYIVLKDVVLPATQGMSAIRCLLVSPYGIFVVTWKDISGQVTGKVGDREWEVKSGFKKARIYNPLWENRKHVNALEDFWGPQPLIPVVVLNRVKFKGEFGNNVVALKNLGEFIRKHRERKLQDNLISNLVTRLG